MSTDFFLQFSLFLVAYRCNMVIRDRIPRIPAGYWDELEVAHLQLKDCQFHKKKDEMWKRETSAMNMMLCFMWTYPMPRIQKRRHFLL